MDDSTCFYMQVQKKDWKELHQDVKNHHTESEQKYNKKDLEENAKLNQEIGNLSKEAQETWFRFGGFEDRALSQNPRTSAKKLRIKKV